MVRKLNYNAARGRKKISNGAVRRIVPDGATEGREGRGKTKLRKATNKRKNKAQEV